MCNIWKNNSSNEITSSELKLILENKFFNQVEHLGISGGEPTLRKDLVEICSAILEILPNLKTLSITSHGYHYEKWAKYLPIIQQQCQEKNISFTLNLSMDGYNEVHNTVRGIPNAFEKLCKTIELALSKNIKIQLQSTISSINLYNIGRTLHFAKSKNIEIVYRVATKIRRLNNQDFIEDIALNNDEKSYFSDFILSKSVMENTESPARRLFYKDLANRLELKQEYRKAPCYFQEEGVLLTSHRELYQCSISDKKICTITNPKILDNQYFSIEAEQERNSMKESLCKSCLHDQSGAWHPYILAREILSQSRWGKQIPFFIDGVSFTKNLTYVLIKDTITKTRKREIPSNLKKIVVIGAYGGEHVGDAAILGGVISRLSKQFRTTNVKVLSIRPERTNRWLKCLDFSDEIQIEAINYTNDNQHSSLKDADALVYGGGPIMDLPKSLVSHLDTILTAKRKNIPFLIEGVGAGPFRNSISILQSNRIFSYADKITIRTQDAGKWIKRNDIKIHIDRDPAFDYLESRTQLSLITKHEIESLKTLLGGSKEKIIGINLRPLWKKYSKNLTAEETEKAEDIFLEKMAAILSSLDSKKNITFIFFPMNPDQYGFSDLSTAYKLEDIVKAKYPSIDYRIWEIEPGIDALLNLIRKLDFAITMRFHASIFCLSQNIPTFGIDYMLQGKGKVFELFKDLGRENNVINITDFNEFWLNDNVKDII